MFYMWFLLFVLALRFVNATLPQYTPAQSPDVCGREGLIAAYFKQGYSYKDIVLFLTTIHGLKLSVARLNQILRRLRLKRRERHTPESLAPVLQAVKDELEESGQCLGYKAMWRRINNNGVRAPRLAVGMALKILQPDLVEQRRRRRLNRRSYANPGPNFCWHVDGYDKLKPFGFAIHAAIDGFSRKVMWLEVGPTNNNPQVIALFYVQALIQHKVVPCLLRSDRGTENVNLEKIQKFLRRNGNDMLAAQKSFVYGRSTANQRIESWWAILRRSCTSFWINLFKDMSTVGLINTDDPVHMNCLSFCFMHLIQKDLNKMATDWNTHHLQAKKKYGNISGKPDKMYFLPEEYGTSSYAAEFNEEEITEIELELELDEGQTVRNHPDFVKMVNLVCPDWNYPESVEEAQNLYIEILGRIAAFENGDN